MPAKISDSGSKKGFISWALSGGIYMKQKGAIFGTSGIAIFFVVIPRWFAMGIERRDNTALMISFGFLIFAIFLIYFGYRVYLQDFEK